MTNVKDGNGLWVWYWKSGQKKKETNYEDGEENGFQISYNEDGTENYRLTYEEGEIVEDFPLTPPLTIPNP